MLNGLSIAPCELLNRPGRGYQRKLDYTLTVEELRVSPPGNGARYKKPAARRPVPVVALISDPCTERAPGEPAAMSRDERFKPLPGLPITTL